jgi:hypothetical protein
VPNKDGTGPTGNGPITGRGRGKCIVPLSTQREEETYLKNRKKVLKEDLASIKTREAKLQNPDSYEQ